jgi:hypothetical protein
MNVASEKELKQSPVRLQQGFGDGIQNGARVGRLIRSTWPDWRIEDNLTLSQEPSALRVRQVVPDTQIYRRKALITSPAVDPEILNFKLTVIGGVKELNSIHGFIDDSFSVHEKCRNHLIFDKY